MGVRNKSRLCQLGRNSRNGPINYLAVDIEESDEVFYRFRRHIGLHRMAW